MSALDWRREWKPLAAIAAVFLACYYLPLGETRFDRAVLEALALAKWYAREHVLLCLIPAFFLNFRQSNRPALWSSVVTMSLGVGPR